MDSDSRQKALDEFEAHLSGPSFPCFAGQTALQRHLVTHVFAGPMACPADDAKAARAIADFAGQDKAEHTFASLVVHFTDAEAMPETCFEQLLFARLQGIHEADAPHHAWDPQVSDDPDDSNFSMSVGGKAFYVVGLHPGASRPARRLAHPALVFNLHEQFEYLRSQGRYERLKNAIVARDVDLNGSANPMLAVHGASSEAIQYSGRHIVGEWRCPFRPHRDKAA